MALFRTLVYCYLNAMCLYGWITEMFFGKGARWLSSSFIPIVVVTVLNWNLNKGTFLCDRLCGRARVTENHNASLPLVEIAVVIQSYSVFSARNSAVKADVCSAERDDVSRFERKPLTLHSNGSFDYSENVNWNRGLQPKINGKLWRRRKRKNFFLIILLVLLQCAPFFNMLVFAL